MILEENGEIFISFSSMYKVLAWVIKRKRKQDNLPNADDLVFHIRVYI